jgi:hypothetical protein
MPNFQNQKMKKAHSRRIGLRSLQPGLFNFLERQELKRKKSTRRMIGSEVSSSLSGRTKITSWR